MTYAEKNDIYICYHNRKLKFTGTTTRKSKSGYLARMNKSIQVEGTFGVIKGNHSFIIFMTRGMKNVKVEFTLLCLAYNINKLHNKIQQNRLGVSFYTKAIARY